jgi:hypothetical protein
MFREKIAVTVGEIVERDSFVFADLLPAAASAQRSASGGEASGGEAAI